MEQLLQVKDAPLAWKQTALDAKGQVMSEREVPVPADKVREEAYSYVDFLEKQGADLRRSVLSEIKANEAEVNSLLQRVRTSHSVEELQALSQTLKEAVELSKHLQTIYDALPLSGTVNVRLSVSSAAPEQEEYTASFTPDGNSWASPRPIRVLAGRDPLLRLLKHELGVGDDAAQAALKDLNQEHQAFIPVRGMTYSDLVRFRLA